MTGKKAHPELVITELVEKAISTGKDRTALFSEYIVLHYRSTGKLAPGCNAHDFYAVLDPLLAAQHQIKTDAADAPFTKDELRQYNRAVKNGPA